LQLCIEGAKRKTEIIYKANLNSKQAVLYLSYLQRNNFIRADKTPNWKGYRITEKGAKFLSKYLQIKQILDDDEPY